MSREEPDLWILIQRLEELLGVLAEENYAGVPFLQKKFEANGVYQGKLEAWIFVTVEPFQQRNRDGRHFVNVGVRWQSCSHGCSPTTGLEIAKLNMKAARLALKCEAVVGSYTYMGKQAKKAMEVIKQMRELDGKGDR